MGQLLSSPSSIAHDVYKIRDPQALWENTSKELKMSACLCDIYESSSCCLTFFVCSKLKEDSKRIKKDSWRVLRAFMYVLLQFLYYLLFFIFVTLCAIMYATLTNSSSNEQNLQSNIQNQIKLAEESLNRFETD